MVALLLVLHPRRAWTYPLIAEATGLSPSASFRAIERLRVARLMVRDGFRVFDDRLLKFLEHGVPYAFPAAPGALSRGVATAHAAAPLRDHINAAGIVVWSHALGKVRGESVIPLAPTAPVAAERDEALYRALALVDALRIGRPRDQKLAMRLLIKELEHARNAAEAG